MLHSASMEAYSQPLILQGSLVRLEPLKLDHAEALFHASKAPEVWQWLTRPAFTDIDEVKHWINHANYMQAIGEQLAFAIIDQSNGLAIGSTRYLNINEANKSLEIGWTWLTPKYWHTRVNSECKYLLLKHAFEDLNVFRVQLLTDNRNIRSKKAIKKLGATLEGVIRSERILYDGHRRDTALFSILNYDWPDIKNTLKTSLSA